MSKVDWSKAPEGAQFYSCGRFRKHEVGVEFYYCDDKKVWGRTGYDPMYWHEARPGFVRRPEVAEEDLSRVHRTVMWADADMVNHPSHYQSDTGIECIDAIRAALGKEGFIAYCRGNAIKYSWRDKIDNAEDARKAAWYSNRAAEEMLK